MDFYKRVGIVCGRIPWGKVSSYGQIALLCGMPKHARQVGFALNRGLAGQGVPAHRVVNSKGYLTGAQSFDGPDTQRRLLEAEGIYPDRDNRVDMDRYGWKNTLEDALWFREYFKEQDI